MFTTEKVADFFTSDRIERAAAELLPNNGKPSVATTSSAIGSLAVIDATIGATEHRCILTEEIAAAIEASCSSQRLTAIACYGWQLDSLGFWDKLRTNGELIFDMNYMEFLVAGLTPPTDICSPIFFTATGGLTDLYHSVNLLLILNDSVAA